MPKPTPTPSARPMLASLISTALVQVDRASNGLLLVARVLEGVALGALEAPDMRVLTDRCYAKARETPREGLFDWELAWLGRDLPVAPASILVGGCGQGRELRWLREHGYRTVAFDPVPRHPDASVLQARYEDLLVPDHPATQIIRAAAPYAAVLLGWGSFSHIPDAAQRQALLATLRQCCDGPLLLSYFSRPSHELAQTSRARDLGVAIGRNLRRGAATSASSFDAPGELILPHCGYAHAFTSEELTCLAENAGYRAECHADDYPHATLKPA